MKVKFFLTTFILIGFYLIGSLSRDLWFLLKKEGEIEKRQLKLEAVELKNAQLKSQLEFVQSQDFIEKEARDKLGLAKEGETVVIIPENVTQVIPLESEKEEELPHWKRWQQLFFGE